MCEIFGFSGKQKNKLNSDLQIFYSHAEKHPNGWGLALFDNNKSDIFRETKRADRSDYLKKLMSKPVYAKTALAHIRLATIGNVEPENCHPFTKTDKNGIMWTLVHNGTVFESDKLSRYVFSQSGETDSERILIYIIDRINERSEKLKRVLTFRERFKIIDEIIRTSSAKNKLNLLIYDGDILYVHTNFRNSLYFREDEYGITFSTQELSGSNWKNVPMNVLLGYCNGSHLFSGTHHNNEHFFDPDAYKPLYMAYSGL